MPAAPVPTVVVVPVASPPDLLGLQMRDLGLCRDSGMNIPIRGWQPYLSAERARRQRHGLRARSERGSTGGSGGKSDGELQKVAALHDVSLFVVISVMRRELGCAEMNDC